MPATKKINSKALSHHILLRFFSFATPYLLILFIKNFQVEHFLIIQGAFYTFSSQIFVVQTLFLNKPSVFIFLNLWTSIIYSKVSVMLFPSFLFLNKKVDFNQLWQKINFAHIWEKYHVAAFMLWVTLLYMKIESLENELIWYRATE